MVQRSLTAIIALLFFVPIIWIGSWVLEAFIVLLAITALIEIHQMKGIDPISIPTGVSSLALIYIILYSRIHELLPELSQSGSVFALFIVLLLGLTLIIKDYTIEDVGVSFMGILYLGTGFHSFILTRENNLHLLILSLIIIYSTDTGAYLVGRKIGKHKLAPSISPNKTVEGSIGGVVISLLISIIYLLFFPSAYSLIVVIPLIVILSVAGQIGDLIESAIKRHFGTKDSGNILPGHGGIFDRFDSLIFVLSVIFIMGLV
ncbi:phosphatidate cytidylyltransferase [Marinilactibacillus sp. Marseille-P9653]|uniref:phosphatidate cytidylyltransferase n=1 Tax=Marinilactibacillus sp. Marseille-P9653 TaxID=2866583 RepID=UPI001CE4AE8A|nr:phosphatidate cytidylyltransferase [Marinilactibacillus sp. Marseille-P9653]